MDQNLSLISISDPEPECTIASSDDDRIIEFENTVIPHLRLKEAKQQIRLLHRRCKRHSKDKRQQLKARALLILGGAGAGKSTVFDDYMIDYPDLTFEKVENGEIDLTQFPDVTIDMLRDADVRKIVLVEAPKKTTQRALVAAILGAYGYKARDSWNTDDIIKQIAFYAAETRTEMIFIDEGHHMVSETNEELTEDVSEFIKSLLNRVKVQIVITGLPRLQQLKNYAQLNRRLRPQMVLTPYDWTTRGGRVAFGALLDIFEMMLKLPEPSNLKAHNNAKRIYVATGGRVGIISKYLSEALSLALSRGLSSVTLDLLAEVYDSFCGEYVEDEGIDFDAELDGNAQAKKNLRDKTEASNNNPFLCSDARLKELWLEIKNRDSRLQLDGQDEPRTEKEPQKRRGRRTRLRGHGRPPYTPFGRN